MKAVAVPGLLLLACVQALAWLVNLRSLLAGAAGIALAALLVGVTLTLTDRRVDDPADTAPSDDAGELLRRWRSSTEARLHWVASTRTDWNRHWRPILARRFEASIGGRLAADPAQYDVTGRLLFGEQLWSWIDPGNVAAADDDAPGPGRAVLEEILQRMERR